MSDNLMAVTVKGGNNGSGTGKQGYVACRGTGNWNSIEIIAGGGMVSVGKNDGEDVAVSHISLQGVSRFFPSCKDRISELVEMSIGKRKISLWRGRFLENMIKIC